MTCAVNGEPVQIRPAAESDVDLILGLIRKLAAYKRLTDTVATTAEQLRDALFGARPIIGALLAYSGDQPAGFALYFETYSTFRGCRGIFLEDLFVEPEHRGRGIGASLLSAVAKLAHERGGWLQWLVLDWNGPAIEFYERLGAQPVKDWNAYRLDGEALARVAAR